MIRPKPKFAIFGASGFVGAELLRLLAGHGGLEAGPLFADSQAGEVLEKVHPHLALAYPGASFEGILGWALSPLAWLLGVPWDHATLVGGAIGQKLAFNEFFAYANLSPTLKAGTLDPRSQAIVCFALCGFANFASIAIQLASFSSLVPERRSEVARYGLRAILAGSLSNLTSAAIAGLFVG